MIRNEAEYQAASDRLADHRARLKEAGLDDEKIKRAADPIESFHLQLKEEVEGYERLKRGEFEELENFRGFGHLLISLRIAQGYRSANWPGASLYTSRRFPATSGTSTSALLSIEPFACLAMEIQANGNLGAPKFQRNSSINAWPSPVVVLPRRVITGFIGDTIFTQGERLSCTPIYLRRSRAVNLLPPPDSPSQLLEIF